LRVKTLNVEMFFAGFAKSYKNITGKIKMCKPTPLIFDENYNNMSASILTDELKKLKIVSAAEGWSFLILLFVAMPLKYVAGFPEAVRVVGMLHGVLFVVYIISVIRTAFEFSWSLPKIFLAFLASIIPFGTFYANRKLFNTEKGVTLRVND